MAALRWVSFKSTVNPSSAHAYIEHHANQVYGDPLSLLRFH